MRVRLEHAEQHIADTSVAQENDRTKAQQKDAAIRALRMTEVELRSQLEAARSSVEEKHVLIAQKDAALADLRTAHEITRSSEERLTSTLKSFTNHHAALKVRALQAGAELQEKSIKVEHLERDLRSALDTVADQSATLSESDVTMVEKDSVIAAKEQSCKDLEAAL